MERKNRHTQTTPPRPHPAAALAATTNVLPRKLDVRRLQSALTKQDVYLGDEERLKELDLLG